MNDMTSLDDNHVPHTCNEKGMGMEEWGRKDLGLICQGLGYFTQKYMLHIRMNQ